MADEGFKRKITAIFSADVEDYSRLMGDDEEVTVGTLQPFADFSETINFFVIGVIPIAVGYLLIYLF